MLNLTIRNKIWLSFGILVVLLVTVGSLTVANLRNNEHKLVELVTEVQPAVVQSLSLVDQLDRASAALGFYLLSKEDIHKQDYLLFLAKIAESMDRLNSMPLIQRSPEALATVKSAGEKIRKLDSYKEHMIRLAEDRALNLPATRYASSEVNPRVQILLQSLQEILFAEQDEKATKERKTFTIEIANLRHMLLSAVNELRLYLAFRADDQIINFRSHATNVDDAVRKINALTGRDSEFLGLDQQLALENFNKSYKEYFERADRLIKIHMAEDWRQDAYIIRKEIAPLLMEVQTILNRMVASQQEKSLAESAGLTQRAAQTQLIVILLSGLGLLSAVAIGYLLARGINNPIMALKASAHELARGKLDHEIDTTRRDELGSLATSFADMRDSIRKKIADLHVLNHAGEDLAGKHTRIEALQTAMRVMQEQTRVQWGSVFLLNEDNQQLELSAYYPERTDLPANRAKTFRVGEGVAGRAAAERRVIYIPDTSQDAEYVASSDPREPRAVICVPMLDDDRVFGVMNFSGEVGRVTFDPTDAEFAETIARMTVVTSKNIHMLNVIEEQNRTLEHKVQERTAELRRKTIDINNMLQNMHQGIFTIHGQNRVHHEYSAYLETILDVRDIANRDAMDLLFTGSDLTTNSLDQIRASLAAILNEDAMMYDFNKHLLVREFTRTLPDGRKKILELEWDPIRGENDVVEKIMVTVRDVTELRSLQEEAKHQKWELEIIGQILAVSKQKFLAFVTNTRELLNDSEAQIRANASASPDTIALLFRNMHTIKGNARTYGLRSITDLVHEAENTYAGLRKSNEPAWDREQLLRELGQVRELVETYDRVYRAKLAGNQADGVFLEQELVDLGKRILAGVDDQNPAELRTALGRVRQLFQTIGTESFTSVLEGVVKAMPEIASRLGKEAPEIVVHDNHYRLLPEVAPVLKNVFVHEFRNAIDHGLESPAERAAQGKPARGTITLEADEDRDHLVIRLFDDGRGLPLDKIQERAIERGLVARDAQLTDDQVAELIFHPGLTTSESVTDLSGRGVGMDAVRKFVTALGGRVELRLKGRRTGNTSNRAFESRITLPRSAYVRLG